MRSDDETGLGTQKQYYWQLPAPVNTWLSPSDGGGKKRFWQMKEAMESVTDRDFNSSEWDFKIWEGAFAGKDSLTGGDAYIWDSDYEGLKATPGTRWRIEDGKVWYRNTPVEGGRMLDPDLIYHHGAGSGLRLFFPSVEEQMRGVGAATYGHFDQDQATAAGTGHDDVRDGWSGFSQHKNYITRQITQGVYYHTPPLGPYGFLDSLNPFALAMKMSYQEQSSYRTTGADSGYVTTGDSTSPDYSYINPCKNCNTIGRAWNGWDRMEQFYTAEAALGTAVYATQMDYGYSTDDAVREFDAVIPLETAQYVISYAVDQEYGLGGAGMATMLEQGEMQTNTYGTAPYKSYVHEEQWYAILTTHYGYKDADTDADDEGITAAASDDFLMLSFYHVKNSIFPLPYYGALYKGGYPDPGMSGTTSTGAPPSVIDYLTVGGTLDSPAGHGQSYVPRIPLVMGPKFSEGIGLDDIVKGIDTAGGGVVTSEAVNYLANLATDDMNQGVSDADEQSQAGCFVAGDKKRRWGTRLSSYFSSDDLAFGVPKAGRYFNNIGTSDFSIGHIANKAWLLQSSMATWQGMIDHVVSQQLSPSVGTDAFSPIGSTGSAADSGVSTVTTTAPDPDLPSAAISDDVMEDLVSTDVSAPTVYYY